MADDSLPGRKDVEKINLRELGTCVGPTTMYLAQDTPGETAAGIRLGRDEATKMLNQETRFPEKLDLRIGAQVMLIMVCSLL
jgi:hypothetical protein